ncbi:MAG: hypothetical protein KatS3mg110_1833 [Pirellulaceae bacterium]|nr:MAG: hypothetical protein KatS3mg110_1833 [Pirellulaceae bacterium]
MAQSTIGVVSVRGPAGKTVVPGTTLTWRSVVPGTIVSCWLGNGVAQHQFHMPSPASSQNPAPETPARQYLTTENLSPAPLPPPLSRNRSLEIRIIGTIIFKHQSVLHIRGHPKTASRPVDKRTQGGFRAGSEESSGSPTLFSQTASSAHCSLILPLESPLRSAYRPALQSLTRTSLANQSKGARGNIDVRVSKRVAFS